MSDTVYTIPTGGNDSAAAMAAMNNQAFNNPWAYLILLALFMNGGFGFGGNRNGAGAAAMGALDVETQNKLNSLSAQLSNDQNTNLVRDAIAGNASAINQLAQTLGVSNASMQAAINSVNMSIANLGSTIQSGNQDIMSQMAQCCCNLRTEVQAMGYQNQLNNCQQTNTIMSGLATTQNQMAAGFTSIGTAINTARCDIVQTSTANTQRIIDTLNNHWTAELQLENNDLRNKLATQEQTIALEAYIASKIPATTTTTATA